MLFGTHGAPKGTYSEKKIENFSCVLCYKDLFYIRGEYTLNMYVKK